MRPQVRASLLWGLVGSLSFLVLLLGYLLATGRGADPAVALGVALLAGAVAAALSYLAAPRLDRRQSERD